MIKQELEAEVSFAKKQLLNNIETAIDILNTAKARLDSDQWVNSLGTPAMVSASWQILVWGISAEQCPDQEGVELLIKAREAAHNLLRYFVNQH